jgi:hypothetical protein
VTALSGVTGRGCDPHDDRRTLEGNPSLRPVAAMLPARPGADGRCVTSTKTRDAGGAGGGWCQFRRHARLESDATRGAKGRAHPPRRIAAGISRRAAPGATCRRGGPGTPGPARSGRRP